MPACCGGVKKSIICQCQANAFESLQNFYTENKGWLFGHLGLAILKMKN